MLNKRQIGKLKVVIPARPIRDEKCLFLVDGCDDLAEINIVEREIQPADEYAKPITKKFIEVNLYGKWQGNGQDIVDSASTRAVVTEVLNEKDENGPTGVWSRVVKALQVSDYELLIIPRYIERIDGEEIAKCYVSDLSIEK